MVKISVKCKKFIKIIIFLQFLINSLIFNFCENVTFGATKNIECYEAMTTIEASTGKILFSKDENKRLPMASTTKILTAIVAIENCNDLNKKHTISKEAVGVEGSSIYLRTGEHLSVMELLYGLMLRSGNDAAVAIAIIVGGSVDEFVVMMNNKCKELGLVNTNIETVNGLHSDNHYTTASDLAKITAYALKNQTFDKIVSSRFTKIDDEFGKQDKHRYLKNKNKLLTMVAGADGVKTGYTKKAGKCFVGSATRNGMRVIVVVLNSKSMFNEATELIEKAFDKYSLINLFEAGVLCEKEILLDNQKTQKVPIIIKNDIKIVENKQNISKITAKLILNPTINLPVKENTEIGMIEVKIENDLIFSEKVYTINIDKNNGFIDNINKIINQF